MGLTIHWNWHGPKALSEAKSIIEKMRQRALDLPFESVSEIVSFKGEAVQFDPERRDDEFGWLKIQSRQTVWNQDGTIGWDCLPKEIVGFQINVAPGSEYMEVVLAAYPKTIEITDEPTGKMKQLSTGFQDWLGRGFCKTQYASDPQCGGVRNFLRAHLSVCRMLDYAKQLGLLVEVSDEGDFYEKRDIAALVKTVVSWNEQIAAFVGALSDSVGKPLAAPIQDFPDFEHLEAKGQDQIDAFFRMLKDESGSTG